MYTVPKGKKLTEIEVKRKPKSAALKRIEKQVEANRIAAKLGIAPPPVQKLKIVGSVDKQQRKIITLRRESK